MQCKIEGDEIVVRVKIDALPVAWMQGPHVESEYDPEDNENTPPVIEDPYLFAPCMLMELLAEDEKGTNILMAAFDEAIEQAINNGADGVAP